MKNISNDQSKLIRTAMQLTTEEFSDLLNVSTSVITKYESNQRNSKLLPQRINERLNNDIITLSADLIDACDRFKNDK